MKSVEELLYVVADQCDERIPGVARVCLEGLSAKANAAFSGKSKPTSCFVLRPDEPDCPARGASDLDVRAMP